MATTAPIGRPRRTQDQPRGLRLHTHLSPKLLKLYYLPGANSRRGAEVASGVTAPAPMRSALVDTRAYVEQTLARLDHILDGILAGGDSVVRVSGWWGTILCPVCGEDTLLLDLGRRWVSCTNTDNCDEGGGQPFSDSEAWLEAHGKELDEGDGKLTVNQRQQQRILELEDALWVHSADSQDLARQAANLEAKNMRLRLVLAAHGLTDPQPVTVSSGHGVFACPETGGDHTR